MTDTLENFEEKRPTYLKVLCILTFVSTGLGVLGVFVQIIAGKFSQAEMEAYRVQTAEQIGLYKDNGWDFLVDFTMQSASMMEDIQANFLLVIVISALSAFLGLYSAIQMWKGRKIGFHLYIIYNLISVSSIYTYTSPANVPTLSLIFGLGISGLFIFMYSRNLHWLK